MNIDPNTTRPTLATVALLMGTFLASLDVNVVGTSLPTVVAHLGGLQLYGWVFAAYLLTSTTTVPLYGRLADTYGRKPLYLTAALLFMTGSFLCGFADTMGQLIAFRAIQGLGAGGLIPITLTLFGDMYDADRRALVQGVFSVVWGVSSVIGPLVGGFLVTYVSWHWVFWVNIPVGLLSVALLALSLHERRAEGEQVRRPDIGGALLLLVALSTLLAAVQLVGQGSPLEQTLPVTALGLLLAAWFSRHERGSSDPVFPPAIFRQRAANVAYVSGLATGGILFSLGAFVPLFVQGVQHGTPTQAGLSLVPLSFTWTLLTFLTVRLARALTYRRVVRLGGVGIVAGGAVLATLGVHSPRAWIWLASALLGAGMALTITPLTISVQDLMPWNRRAMATAMMQFTRTVGGTLAVTVLGIVVSRRFHAHFPGGIPGVKDPGELLDPKRWASIPPRLLDPAREALHAGLHQVFIVLASLGVLALLVLLLYPRVDAPPA